MKTYLVSIYKKQLRSMVMGELIDSVEIEAENDTGILLRGKVALRMKGIEYNKKKHDIGYREI